MVNLRTRIGKSAHGIWGIKKAPAWGACRLVWLVELGLGWALSDGRRCLGDGDAVGVGGDAGVRPDSQNVVNGFLDVGAEVYPILPFGELFGGEVCGGKLHVK